MNRKFRIMRISPNGRIVIGIDSLEMKEITAYIGQDERYKDKFKDVVSIVLEGLHCRHLYKREKISKEIKNVTAIRLFVGQENDRIYCQELSYKNKKIVVLSRLHLHKPDNDLSKKEIKIITDVSNYLYEIEQDQKHRLDEPAK